MTSFTWEDRFITGDETIDLQHREIFEHMTAIYKEMAEIHQKTDSLNTMLDRLKTLSRLHFSDEEQLMKVMNYPLAAEHKQLHELILLDLERFMVSSNKYDPSSMRNDFYNIREVFITHVLNEGMAFREFINEALPYNQSTL